MPVVSTTAAAAISRPSFSRTPATRPPMTRRSATSPSTTREIRLGGDLRLHGGAIERAVGLRARAAHGRTLAPVQDAELDAGAVGDAAHQAVERIDLAHQMALAEPADRRVAGHLADGREAVRHENRIGAESGRRRRGFRAGMPTSDDDDVRRFIRPLAVSRGTQIVRFYVKPIFRCRIRGTAGRARPRRRRVR